VETHRGGERWREITGGGGRWREVEGSGEIVDLRGSQSGVKGRGRVASRAPHTNRFEFHNL